MNHFKSHFDNDRGIFLLRKKVDQIPLTWLELSVIPDGGSSTTLTLHASKEDLIELRKALSELIDSWNTPNLRVVQ